MKCTDCPYYWADIEEYMGDDGKMHARTIGREYCHYAYNDGYAPCEAEEYYEDVDYSPEYEYEEDYE